MQKTKSRMKRFLSLLMVLLMVFGAVLPPAAFAAPASTSQQAPEEPDEEPEEAQNEEDIEIDQSPANPSEDLPYPSINDWSEPEIDPNDFSYDGFVQTDVLQELEKSGSVDVIIRLKNPPDKVLRLEQASSLVSPAERATQVVKQLQTLATQAQAQVEPEFLKLLEQGLLENVQPFWIINGYSATITPQALEFLLGMDQI